jgi:DNA-binding transcriptional MocR family regulator
MIIPGLKIDLDSEIPVYRQIAEGIQAATADGRLSRGDRLPPSRDLARALGVNRNTVVAAYDLLASSGFVHGRTGRGTFIASETEAGNVPSSEAERPEDPWFSAFSQAVDGPGVDRLLSAYQLVTADEGISFAGSYPDSELLPVQAFMKSIKAAMKEEGPSLLAYGPTAGYPALRNTLAGEMNRKGDEVDGNRILVTNGAQQGLELIFRTFLDTEDTVLVEDPTYTGALSVLGSLRAKTIGVPMDEQGIRPDLLEAALIRHKPRLIYLQPTFQNPTTAVMPESRRREVLSLAIRYGCPVVEDDWAGDLRFEGKEIPTLHALDRGRHVIYLGTFSKKLMPGVRIGWVAAPKEVLRKLIALKQISDCGTSPILQAGLHFYLVAGCLRSHLKRVRAEYRNRRDLMLESMSRYFPPRAGWSSPPGGLFLWVRLPDGLDSGELFAAARRRGVLFSRGDLFHVDGQTPGCGGAGTMRLTYSSVPPDRIDLGIRILGDLIRSRWSDSTSGDGEPLVGAMPIL